MFAFIVNNIKKPKPSTAAKPEPTAKKHKDTDLAEKIVKKVEREVMTIYHILRRHVYLVIMGVAFLLVLVIIVLCLCRYDIVLSLCVIQTELLSLFGAIYSATYAQKCT